MAALGILALQGDVREHRAAFRELGVPTVDVRRPEELDGLAGIVLPGGESTTLSLLLGSSGLFEPLARALAGGLPAFGTCAGLVLLARSVLDGRPDQRSFGVLDCTVRRNGYGRQRFSFEAVLDAPGGPLPAVFIRAPRIVDLGSDVEVLATLDRAGEPGDAGPGEPVACRQGAVMATAFHPELTGDRRLHRLFATMAGLVPAPGPGAAAPGR